MADECAARSTVRRLLGAASAGLAVACASACAAVPDGGIVTSATIAPKDGQQAVVQMIPSGPQPGWGPEEIVSGFLLASANFTNDHAIAREYLTPAAAKAWRPGSSVIEFENMPAVTTGPVQTNMVTVRVTGNELGVISEDGQYLAAEQGTTQGPVNFTVVHGKGGQWRIVNPPDVLLFSKTEVSRTFRSRDLFFFDPTWSSLVPDPVYVPAEATSRQLVAHLVAALQQGPQGWLAAGTKTAFPPGTSLLGTSIAGSTATVNLGGRVARANVQQLEQMAAQLLQTLAGTPPYPQPDTASVQSVVFEINGKPVRLSCTTGQPPALQDGLGCTGPLPGTGTRAYFVDTKGRVATLFGSRPDNPAPGPAGTAQVHFQKIAVSPDQMSVAGVSNGVLYTGGLTQNGSLARRLAVTRITSLSWDNSGLWVAGQVGRLTHVWWLDKGVRPVIIDGSKKLGPVSVLRVAPDGVRVTFVAGSGAGTRLWLAAIERSGDQAAIGMPVPIGTDVPGQITDLTWYDTGDVIALTQLSSGSELYEVAVDGAQSRLITTEPDTVSVTASSAVSGGSQLVAERRDGTLIQLPDPSGSIWRPVETADSLDGGRASRGVSPVYPG